MIPNSEPIGPPKDPAAAERAAAEEMLKKPMLSVDPQGRLFLSLPLDGMDEIVARGFEDVARSEVLDFYARRAQTRKQLQGGVLNRALGAAADNLGLCR